MQTLHELKSERVGANHKEFLSSAKKAIEALWQIYPLKSRQFGYDFLEMSLLHSIWQ